MAPTENQRSIPRAVIIIVALIVAARIAVTFIPKPGAKPAIEGPSLVHWVPLEQAKSRAAQTHKMVLYEFSAAWCGPCQLMEREVFADARLATRINMEFVPVRVIDRQQEDGANAPEIDELQRLYAVRAFPTLIAATAQGTLIGRVEGYGGPDAFEHFIDAPRTSH
jgi:thioredoxin-related protein